MPKDRNSTQHSTPPGPQQMAGLLGRCGVPLSPPQLDRLWKYHQLLREHNPQLNLSRIHSFSNMVVKLYADSILPGRLMDLPSPLLDLGTGPGMPGIPLKIAYPHLHIILAESRRNRVDFLKMVLEHLSLDGIELLGKGVTPDFDLPVAGVITRAVEKMGATLARVGGCVERSGLVVFMKGPHCDEELQEAISQYPNQYRLVQDVAYRIPHTPHDRRLIVFERTSDPSRVGKASAMERHGFREIESEQNEIFKDLKKLLTSRGIKKQGKALMSGRKQVEEALRSLPDRCAAWISRAPGTPPPESAPAHVVWYELAAPLFDALDTFGTKTPLLVVRVNEIPRWEPSDGLSEGCSVLIPFQDPENVGAAIRSAVAFGAAQIILLEESAHPYHPKAMRASGGTVLRGRLLAGPSIGALSDDLPIVPLSSEGADISAYPFPDRFGLLPGIEGPGLPAHWRDRAVGIPIRPEAESLNAAVALGIALHAWSSSGKK